jgi:proline iminopeptidase
MQLRSTTTRPIDSLPGGPSSISEVNFVDSGGVAHWVLMRGRSVGALPLVFIHGGPGSSEWMAVRAYLGALEHDFVVVNYDQRGVGRSPLRNIGVDTLTIQQHVDDLHRIVQHVQRRLNIQRVLVVGHSWGTVIGAMYAHQHPENVLTYLSIAQVTNSTDSEQREYDAALASARADSNQKAVNALEAIGAPPHDKSQEGVLFRWTTYYGGTFFEQRSWWKLLLRTYLQTPEASPLDLARIRRGMAVEKHMTPLFFDFDIRHHVPHLEVPIALALGRFDRLVDPELSAAWVDDLSAPAKLVRWFERSAHSIPFEQPTEFCAFVSDAVDLGSGTTTTDLSAPRAPR